MDKVRYGVIGYGNMGTSHAGNIFGGKIEGADLAAVCDSNAGRLAAAKDAFGENVRYFESSSALLESDCCDAVVLAIPHYDHPVIGTAAFEKGINVLCEKPVGVFTKNIYGFMDAAKKSGKSFGMMFNQRTNPVYQKVRDLVKDGELGEMKRVAWLITNWYRTQSYYDSGGWRATWSGEGGGVLLNQAPHNLDLWQWICGMPVRLRAFCEFGKYHDIEVEDDVTAYAQYANGATGVFITTTGEYPGTNRLEISGDNGKIVVEDDTVTFWRLNVSEREFNRTCKEGFGSPGYEKEVFTFESVPDQHNRILRNFTGAILHGDELLAPGYDGIHELELSNAMLLSTWTDDWVGLPVDGDKYYEFLERKVKASRVKDPASGRTLDVGGTFSGTR